MLAVYGLVNLFLAVYLSYDNLEWMVQYSNRQYYAVTRIKWFQNRVDNADEVAEWMCRYVRVPIFVLVNGLVTWVVIKFFQDRQ